MVKERQRKDTLDFIDKVEQENKNYRIFFDFLARFIKIYQKEEQYHINTIDELRIKVNENAHSRILEKLLQQKTPYPDNNYEILKSFIKYVKTKKDSFGEIEIEKPEITQEKERIDLWIKEKNKYAIIIENKIHDADNTENQLANYIIKTQKHYKYNEKQIFIIYLNEKEPDEQSWGNRKERFKDRFKDRYLRLSFKDDILPWLRDDILPYVTEKMLSDPELKEKYLFSALIQYIDYLDGKYNLRNINKELNMELHEFIKKEWQLTDNSPFDNISKLISKKEEIKKVDEQIDFCLKKFEENILNDWYIELKAKYSKYNPFLDEVEDGFHVGLIIPIQRKNVKIFVDTIDIVISCNIDALTGKVKKQILKKFPDWDEDKKNKNLICKQFNPRYENYFNAYDTLKKAIPILIEMSKAT